MNIINDVKRVVPFEHLSVGDTFMICDKHYLYMKTMPMSFENKPVNSVVLNDGAIRHFKDDEQVIVVECETRIVKEGW